MAIVGVLTVVMGVNNAPLMAGLAAASGQLSAFSGAAGAAFAAARTAAVGLGLGVVGGAALGINAAGDFEDAFAGVRKTVSETELAAAGLTFEDLARQFRDMATEIPVGVEQLAAIGETAGALGIRATDIEEFTRTVALLGATTNLSTDEAAEALGKVGTILGLTGTEFEEFSDILVNLGNTGASTEGEIIEITKRFAGAGQAVGLTTPQILAFSSAIASAGVEPEAAGSSLSRLFTGMVRGAANGTKAGQEFAKLTGQSFSSFSQLVETDTVGAMQMVLQSLQGLDKFDQVRALEALGITAVRDQNAIRLLAQTYDTNLVPALQNAGVAQGALATEAEKRFDTFNSRLSLLGQNFNELLITIGTPLLPIATDFVASITGAIKSVSEWLEANSTIVPTILSVTAAVAALVAVALSLGAIMGVIGTVIGVITSPILLVIAAIVGLAAHFGLLGDDARQMVDSVLETVGQLAQSFLDWIGPLIPQAISALQVLAGQILGWIGAQVPVWLIQLGVWAGAFVDWIAPMIPRALGALGDFVAQAIAWIAAQLPVWLAALLGWADAFIGWIAPLIPPFLVALGQFAAAAIAWILQQIPVVAVALGKLAIEFVAWVLPKIPVLLVSLGQLAIEVLAWIARQIPKIAEAVLGWAGALVGWIIESIPGMLENLATWLLSVLLWLASVPGQIAEAAFKIGEEIADGIIDGIGDIGARVGERLSTIPGVELVGDVAGNVGGVIQWSQGGFLGPKGGTVPGIGKRPLEFAHGGMVPGIGPQLAIVHGGEMVVPPGRGGTSGGPGTGGTLILQVDGHEMYRVTDERLAVRESLVTVRAPGRF